jgi:hypothetical protein
MIKQLPYQNFYLLVDTEAPIKEGDYFLNTTKNTVHKCHSISNNIQSGINGSEYHGKFESNKILAQSKQGTLKDIPYYELEKDVEKIALQAFPIDYQPLGKQLGLAVNPKFGGEKSDINYFKREGFITGYKAAKSKQFTEEDLRKAMQLAYKDGAVNSVFRVSKEDEIIQSFTPSIEIEMEEVCSNCGEVHGDSVLCMDTTGVNDYKFDYKVKQPVFYQKLNPYTNKEETYIKVNFK